MLPDRPASEIYDGEHVSQGSRDMTKGKPIAETHFRDRLPHEAPTPNLEPEPRDRPLGSSMWIADEAPDAPLWLVKDVTTGHVFARVRGSLPWIVSQMRLLAGQLGGQEKDLFYQRARGN
jgi:hypothetical protein